MSTSNENEPQERTAPADPGPPEWLKKANASKERARTLFPKSTIGQTPRSTIGLPSEPVASAPASIADASSAAAPAASTSSPETAAPPLSGSSVDGPALPTPALPTPAPVAAEASHPYLPYTAPLTTSASSDAVPAIPTPPVRPATPASSNPYAKPASSNPYATPATSNPYAAPGTTSAAALAGKGLSVTSMILGCIGVVLTIVYLGFFPALAAVITGHMAQRRQPAAKAFWITGLITGYLSLVISTILVVWIVAIFVQSYMAIRAVP